MPERPVDSVTCYEILHAGGGPRGESVEVTGLGRSMEWYADQAAEHFDDIEMRREGLEPGDMDGSVHHVEVCYPGREPGRFAVRCRVERVYEATRED